MKNYFCTDKFYVISFRVLRNKRGLKQTKHKVLVKSLYAIGMELWMKT